MIPLRDHTTRSAGATPIITILLIVANVLLFLFELSLGNRLNAFMMSAAFVPARIAEGGISLGDLGTGLESGLLSMFLHGGWGHLLGNMLFLWIFGDNVEDRLGHTRFLAFYILCGYAATFAHFWANPGSPVPAVGASGAISGVLGAYLFLHPQARIDTLVFFGFFARIILVPAWVFLPLWFLMQFFSGIASLRVAEASGGVAWFAHIGGFIAGPVLLFLLGGGRRAGRAPEVGY
jgi:membrane associated rhomboid family serine protease